MKQSKALFVTALAIPALLAFTLPRARVTFGPEAGSKLTKAYETTLELTLEDRSSLMNGQESPMMPDMDSASKQQFNLTVTDEYVSVGDGRPTKLKRSFDRLEFDESTDLSVDMMGESSDFEIHGHGNGALEGTTVVFDWNEDDEAFEKSFDGDGDEDLLEHLVEDTDLRLFLPEDDVAEGDEWQVDPACLIDVFFPGGDFAIEVEGDGDEPPFPGMDPKNSPSPRELFAGDIDGEITATFEGTREVDDIKVAVIAISLEVDAARDMTDLISEMMDEMMPEGMEMTVDSSDVEVSLSGEGQLLWDLGGGHVHAFELTADLEMSSDSSISVDMGGQSMSVEESSQHSGTLRHAISLE